MFTLDVNEVSIRSKILTIDRFLDAIGSIYDYIKKYDALPKVIFDWVLSVYGIFKSYLDLKEVQILDLCIDYKLTKHLYVLLMYLKKQKENPLFVLLSLIKNLIKSETISDESHVILPGIDNYLSNPFNDNYILSNEEQSFYFSDTGSRSTSDSSLFSLQKNSLDYSSQTSRLDTPEELHFFDSIVNENDTQNNSTNLITEKLNVESIDFTKHNFHKEFKKRNIKKVFSSNLEEIPENLAKSNGKTIKHKNIKTESMLDDLSELMKKYRNEFKTQKRKKNSYVLPKFEPKICKSDNTDDVDNVKKRVIITNKPVNRASSGLQMSTNKRNTDAKQRASLNIEINSSRNRDKNELSKILAEINMNKQFKNSIQPQKAHESLKKLKIRLNDDMEKIDNNKYIKKLEENFSSNSKYDDIEEKISNQIIESLKPFIKQTIRQELVKLFLNF